MKDNKDICSCNIINIENVENAKNNLINEDLLGTVADFFKLLSDKTRLRIITILLKNELCVCDIANVLNMSQSSISHQLRVLRQFRVVKNRKEGKIVYYSLDDEHIENIIKQGIEHYEHSK